MASAPEAAESQFFEASRVLILLVIAKATVTLVWSVTETDVNEI